jgi:DNA-binding transcriptional ArsR family regulator
MPAGTGAAAAAATRRRRVDAGRFAALGDETRLRLLARLAERSPQSIAQLTEGSHVTRQAITKHLTVLRGAGLVRSTPRGRQHLFSFEPRALDDVRQYLDGVSEQWDRALARLKAFVEG